MHYISSISAAVTLTNLSFSHNYVLIEKISTILGCQHLSNGWLYFLTLKRVEFVQICPANWNCFHWNGAMYWFDCSDQVEHTGANWVYVAVVWGSAQISWGGLSVVSLLHANHVCVSLWTKMPAKKRDNTYKCHKTQE